MSSTASPRRRGREIALQVLIQIDVSPELAPATALRLFFDHLVVDGDLETEDPVPQAPFDRQLVDELVAGVAARREEIDRIVQEMSRNWRLERMALVERNVIRIALFEMKFATPVIPISVAINEAIELTKRYGSAEGSAFVNGLLDRAVTELQLKR